MNCIDNNFTNENFVGCFNISNDQIENSEPRNINDENDILSFMQNIHQIESEESNKELLTFRN